MSEQPLIRSMFTLHAPLSTEQICRPKTENHFDPLLCRAPFHLFRLDYFFLHPSGNANWTDGHVQWMIAEKEKVNWKNRRLICMLEKYISALIVFHLCAHFQFYQK